MRQCSVCGTLNKDETSKCGVCGAEFVPGRTYERPAAPALVEYEDQDWAGSSRTSKRAWSALGATILVLIAGVSSILYAGTAGIIIGGIMIVLGLSIGRSTIRYFRGLPVESDHENDEVNQSQTSAEMERPVFNGSIAPLGSLLQEMDRAENRARNNKDAEG